MTEPPRVVIVTARCSQDKAKLFGLRCERAEASSWLATWAFALKESVAGREGYESSFSGSLSMDDGYPGCPTCERHGLAVCGSCGGASCWEGGASEQTCPWCGTRYRIEGEITSIKAGGDR